MNLNRQNSSCQLFLLPYYLMISSKPNCIVKTWSHKKSDKVSSHTILIYVSLEHGVIPNKLNKAIVAPVHMNSKRDAIEQYRQVALLSVIS